MDQIGNRIKTGEWLTAARARAYCTIMIAAFAIAIAAWLALSHDMIAHDGQPIGTDFSDPYAAGKLAWAGKAADAYNPALQHAAEKAVFDGRDVPFYGWHYPPFFFAIAIFAASMPYALSLFVWLAASLAAYLVALHAILPRRETVMIALAFPAVLINIGHGQNGFLTAALLGGSLAIMDRRPWVSGILIGLLAYKPQFGMLIPLALLAAGRWRVIVAAGATVMALIAVTTMLLGIGIWQAFLESTSFTQNIVLEQGGTGWEKIQSIFSMMRRFGADVHTAYIAQSVLAVLLAASIAWLWRSKASFELKASALATACLLATPYVLDYDMMVLAVSIAFFARDGFARGFRHYEITVLALVWIAPLIARTVAGLTGLPLGLMAMTLLYLVTLRRAAAELDKVKQTDLKFAQA